jgi:FkbM family methyltransferase
MRVFLKRLIVSLLSFLQFVSSYSLLTHHSYNDRLFNLTTEYIKSPIEYVLDVGAFHGQWTNILRRANILKDGVSIMIEGNRDLGEIPHDSRDTRIAQLVGAVDGSNVRYFRVKDHEEGNSIYPEPMWFFKDAEMEERQVYTVDTLLQLIGKEDVSFQMIYFDLQGSELNAIKGSSQTLSKVKSGVVIVKVCLRNFSNSPGPSFFDIQMEMYRHDFIMISIIQYYFVTKKSGERILTHMDIAWQRREYVTWMETEERWDRRDYSNNFM